MERIYNKYLDTQVVHLDFPEEITLAINITNCPNKCPGCHSKELWDDIGNILDEDAIDALIEKNKDKITCIGLMGGDANVKEVITIAKYIRDNYPDLKIGWYSGRTVFPLEHGVFHYIKLGPWMEERGTLCNANTNQVYYMNLNPDSKDYIHATFVDITEKAFRTPKMWEL